MHLVFQETKIGIIKRQLVCLSIFKAQSDNKYQCYYTIAQGLATIYDWCTIVQLDRFKIIHKFCQRMCNHRIGFFGYTTAGLFITQTKKNVPNVTLMSNFMVVGIKCMSMIKKTSCLIQDL